MAVTNRDEFSARVKKIAAQRTGYRCSLCSISTIGPSHKSSVSTACIGEAAHICAAAPKGARYDPFMTPEERASVDNCIWMCKIHARVIDVDEAKYTVDYLRELKIKAEKYAEDAISDVDIFRNTYNTLGEDVSSLNAHFLQMIQEGNFDLLRNILENYTNTISSTYDELVLRYKIIYDIYCNRIALNEHINEYLKLSIHTGVKQILEYAISFGVVDVVSKLIDLSEDEKITQIGNMLVNGTLESSLIGKPEVSDTFQIDKEQYNVINHYIIHRAIAQNMYRLKTVDGHTTQ